MYTPENTVFIGKPVNVYVDGKLVKMCREANSEAGYAICAKVDDDGNIVCSRGEVVEVTFYGVVTIEPMDI